MADVNIIDANKLQDALTAQTGQSFIMIDTTTNEGLIIDYDRLATAIASKVVSNTMPSDGLKFVVVG